MRTIYLDGQYLKVNAQIIEAFSPGAFKAKGVFETMLGLDGLVLDTTLHLKRLRAGLKSLGIRSPSFDPSVLKEVLRCNQLPSARVRLMIWQEGKQTHVMITATPFKAFSGKKYRVCLIKTDRADNSRLANVKSLDYGLFAQAFALARARGFDEALLRNRHGYIFEASRANIFWIKDKILYTPPLSSGCLNGITRQQVIKHARNLGISVKERDLTPETIQKAPEVFLTNSLLGIIPVEQIKFLTLVKR